MHPPRKLFRLTASFLLLFAGSVTQSLSAQALEDADTVCTNPDKPAMAPEGFFRYVAKTFNYPKRCQSQNINGYVLLSFLVDKDGSISQITALETTEKCPEFTTEAIRVLQKSAKWTPAEKNGRPVKSYRKMPIRFEAPGE